MKKIKIYFTASMVLLLFSTHINAQYRTYKDQYKNQIYWHEEGDFYSPLGTGLASALIPGLGQVIAEEYARGALFFGGWLGGSLMYVTGFVYIFAGQPAGLTQSLFFGGLAVSLTTYIWSIVDAVQVAQIKNLYHREHSLMGSGMKIHPFISQTHLNKKPYLGLQLSYSF